MNNRWLVLIAACVIQTVLGGIYAWSTFVPYLNRDYGISIGQCGMVFGTTILMFTVSMVFAGSLLNKKGLRFCASISAGLFMLGYIFASFSGGSQALLLLSVGAFAGCGIGFGYVCPLAVGMKWFPDRKGLVTGVVVAGFGAGAVLLSSIGESYLRSGVDVLMFFRWYGIIAGVILFASALLLSEPDAEEATQVESHGLSAVFDWPFYINVIGIFAGTFAGLMIIGNLTSIILSADMTEQHAVLAVSIFAIGNGAGRIIWGRLFDILKYKSIPISLLSFALVAALLLLPVSEWILLVTVFLIGFCFASSFVIYASAISSYFGVGSFSRLYPICFMAYGIAGVIGPGTGGFIADETGSYSIPIYICIALVLSAGVLSYLKLPVFTTQTAKK